MYLISFLVIVVICAEHSRLSRCATPESKPIVLTVKEETRIGTVISNGSLAPLLQGQSRPRGSSESAVNAQRWRLMQSGSELFGIDSTGAIYVRNRIDMESLCSQHTICCSINQRQATIPGTNQRIGQNECFFTLLLDDEVRASSLVIVVQDVNEFVPQFPQPVINVSLYENSGETYLRLPMPKDDDATSSKFAYYQISYPDSEPSGQNIFVQSQSPRRIDTSAGTELRIPFAERSRFEIDRERRDNYRFRISTCETESLTRCSNTTVIISVLDANDNKPRFSQSEYEMTIQENATTHSPLFHVTALDSDIEQNGEVQYSIDPESIRCITPGSPVCRMPNDGYETEPLFTINDNGAIMLNNQADFENCTLFTFRVQARDRGTPPLSSFADIKVHVTDVDDTKPCLRLEPRTNVVEVEEGRSVPGDTSPKSNRISAFLVAADPDTPRNAVQCRSEVEFVQLTEMNVYGNSHEKTYQIVPTRPFDREYESQHQVRLVCSDSNFTDEAQLESLVFTLVVTDLNDNAPRFAGGNISVTLRENSPQDTLITTLVAEDFDTDANAQVEYALLRESPYVTVEPNGAVRSRETIDREKMQRFEAVVIARDSGSPRLTSTATLMVTIIDENDCVPEFDREMYKFEIPENVPTNNNQYYIGEVKARDADSESTLTYSLLNGTEYFLITAQAGSLFLQKPIDREQFQRYTFIVAVSDSDSAISHTSTIPVHVWIDDVNDKAPIITAPTRENHTIRVPCPKEHYANGYRIYQASAVDDDATSENRRTEYLIEVISPPDAPRTTFRMENATGEIYFMQTSCARSYALRVIAVDADNRSLRSEQTLNVVFLTAEVSDRLPGDSSNRIGSSVTNQNANGYQYDTRSSGRTNQSVLYTGLTNQQLMIVLATTLFVLFVALLIVLLVFIRLSRRKADLHKNRRKANESHTESGRNKRVRPDRLERQDEEAASIRSEDQPHDHENDQDESYCGRDDRSEPIYEDGELNNNYAIADNSDSLCGAARRESKSVRNTPLHSEVHSFKPTATLPRPDSSTNTYCDSVSPCVANANGANGSASYHSFQLVPVAQNFSSMQKYPNAAMMQRAPFAAHHQTLQLKSHQQHSWLPNSTLRCVPVDHYDSSAASQTLSFQKSAHGLPSIHNSVLSSTLRGGALEHKLIPTAVPQTPQRHAGHGDPSSFV